MECKMKISELIYQLIGVTPEIQKKLLFSVLLVVLLRLVWLGVLKLLQRVMDSISRYELNKITANLLIFIGVLVIGWIWFCWFEPWVVFIGIILGAAMVAFKELLFDLVGWAYLVWRRPFEVGEWVAVGEATGEVLKIDHLKFSLLETSGIEVGKLRNGQIVQVPNGKIFREKLVNYTKGYHYVWHEFTVYLTLDSNWQMAKELLLRIVNRYIEVINQNNDPRIKQVAERCGTFYSKLEPEIYTQVSDSRIILITRFLCEPDKRRMTMHAIWEDVLRDFRQTAEIKFACSQLLDYPECYEKSITGQIASTSEPSQE
jgi:small-conductance mechanosensitive channel